MAPVRPGTSAKALRQLRADERRGKRTWLASLSRHPAYDGPDGIFAGYGDYGETPLTRGQIHRSLKTNDDDPRT